MNYYITNTTEYRFMYYTIKIFEHEESLCRKLYDVYIYDNSKSRDRIYNRYRYLSKEKAIEEAKKWIKLHLVKEIMEQ
jgi:hypothetical protein